MQGYRAGLVVDAAAGRIVRLRFLDLFRKRVQQGAGIVKPGILPAANAQDRALPRCGDLRHLLDRHLRRLDVNLCWCLPNVVVSEQLAVPG